MKENIVFWNPWWGDRDFQISINNRYFFETLSDYLERKEIVFFSGVRRSGKTTAMYYLIQELLKAVQPENIFYLNLDDEVLQFEKLSEIYSSYKEIFPDVKGKKYIFLDEIQNIDDWERWVKNIYDSFEDVKFVITGSKSHIVKRESVLLTGRILELEIFPLSFKEFITFKNKSLPDNVSKIREQAKLKLFLKEFIEYGGFPEITQESHLHLKTILAKEYYNNIKNKDIVSYFSIKDAKKFDRLSLYLISNIAKPISANKLAALTNLSAPIVNTYIDYAEMMYFFMTLHHFSFSLKGQITMPRKIYSIDTGLANAVAFQFSENIGRYIENIVFMELKRRGAEIFYYSDKYECDFILREGIDFTSAIQVCYELNNENGDREFSGLLEVIDKFKITKGLILTVNDKFSGDKPDNIEIKSLINWLLE